MLISLINGIVIGIGGAVGTVFGKYLKENIRTALMSMVGLIVFVIGVQGVMSATSMIVVMVSLFMGVWIGEMLDVEARMERVGDAIEARIASDSPQSLSKAFVYSSLVMCMGAMAIVGGLQAGMSGQYDILIAKTTIDGVASVIFASTMGIGVALAGVTVFLYQGFFTIVGWGLGNILAEHVVADIGAVGSVIIIALGMNMLGTTTFKPGNMVPAIILPFFLHMVSDLGIGQTLWQYIQALGLG